MDGTTRGASSPWLGRIPLLAVAAMIVGVNGLNVARQYRAAQPDDPFEAAETVEAWRSAHGIRVYDPAPGAHATHMYGALAPWTLGKLFQLTTPDNRTGRLVTLACSLTAVAVLALSMRDRRARWVLLVGLALFIALNRRSSNYFAVNRPDMPALMLAALGVLFMGWGHERRRWAAVVLGTACVVTGFYFKQTAAIVAVVPMIALVLRWRRPTAAEVVFAVFPLAAVVATIQGMKLVNPAMYRAMIVMPRAFALNHAGTVRVAMELLLDYPLFGIVVAEWLKNDARALRDQPRLLWVVATFAVTFPFSAVTAAKVGGTWNSLLPALLAMTALIVLRLPRFAALLDDPATRPARRLALGSFLAALMLVGAFPHMTRQHGLFVRTTSVGASYQRALARAAELPGLVLSPEDPTIALFAKGQLGRNLYCERDCHLVAGDYPKTPPAEALAEMRAADYLVDVRWYFNDLLDDSTLASIGFEPVEDPAFEGGHYRLWRRADRQAAGAVTVR